MVEIIMENKIVFYMNEVEILLNGDWVPPVTCEIDPSNACNLNCNFCMYSEFRSKDKSLMDMISYEVLVNELSSLGVKSITFTGGGEPLIHPKINEMAMIAYSLHFDLGLITNGILLDRIKDPSIYSFIRISLDASNEKMYKKVKGKDFFNKVVDNVHDLVLKNKTDVGLSYVVCEENVHGINEAIRLANELDVDYIQFKPAWMNGKKFPLPEMNGNKIITTDRYKAEDNLPCKIAGLVGIITASGEVYFCCQKRGEKDFCLGNIKDELFSDIWKRRLSFIPDVSKCPNCRYGNYAIGYKKFSGSKYKFLRHKNFL